MSKTAATDYPIHNTLAIRWSPYVFSGRPVPADDLRALFEAARWAPSSYNEQPWRYIVGVAGHDDTHQRILQCLVAPNQAWAMRAPVLALGVVVHTFAASGNANRAAIHDLGLASGNLVIEASTRGLFVHQMIGVDPDTARAEFRVPENAEVYTALAIGYRDASETADPVLRQRESGLRTRQRLDEFVFGSSFGTSAEL